MDCKECGNIVKVKCLAGDYCSNFKNSGVCANYKPKDPVIYVPEDIVFRVTDDRLALDFGYRQSLYYQPHFNTWFVLSLEANTKAKTKLTPIDRKDLKAGDWAYSEEWEDLETIHHSKFNLILDNNKLARIVNYGHGGMDIVVRDEESAYWYKVEKA